MKKWTSLLAAAVLVMAAAVQPMALSSLREQEAQDTAQAEEKAGQEADPVPEEDAAQAEGQPEEREKSGGSGAAKETQPTASSSAEQAVLDSAPLGEPQAPSSAALDGLVDDVMDDIVTDDMDTYSKVKACYDYVTDNVSYGNHMAYMSTPIGQGTCWDVYMSHGEVEGFGAVALTAGKGMCNAYASAFILMVRQLGLNPRLVKGYTLGGGGSYAYHEWAELDIDGVTYVFDPQLEQDLVKSGLPAYTVFCKPYASLGRRYQK